MRAYKSIFFVLVAGLLMAGCKTDPEPAAPEEHPFTEDELQKKKVDEAFTVFFQYLDAESISENPYREVTRHSHIDFLEEGILRYSYVRGDLTLIKMDVKLGVYTAELYGGIRVEGEYPSEEAPVVYIDGERLATLGFVWYEYRDCGETVRELTPVFCFDDGTSYAVSGVLLVEPLIDFLLKNVFATE